MGLSQSTFESFDRFFSNSANSAGASCVFDLPVCDNHPAELPHWHGHLQAQVHRAALQAVCLKRQLSNGYKYNIYIGLCRINYLCITSWKKKISTSQIQWNLFCSVHIMWEKELLDASSVHSIYSRDGIFNIYDFMHFPSVFAEWKKRAFRARIVLMKGKLDGHVVIQPNNCHSCTDRCFVNI